MTDWAGFWLGMGMFLGLACIGHGLICIAKAIVIKELKREAFND